MAGLLRPAGQPHADAGALSGGGRHPSGTGRADGDPVGPSGGGGRAAGSPGGGAGFAASVPPGGYAWWYIDALSDDGRDGLTLIAFVGSVFSPYYALARRRGPADPVNHCAINVALYGRARRWSMTERGRAGVEREPDHFQVGPSGLWWEGDVLHIRIDEVAVPWPARIRGVVRVHPAARRDHPEPLDAAGRHRWTPIAPVARVEVDLERPSLAWSGAGYLDANVGDEPLEAAFRRWHWSRAAMPDGTAILYDVERRDGSRLSLAVRAAADGRLTPIEPPPLATLPRTGWRIARATRSDAGALVARTLEDTPCYARSLVDGAILGQAVRAVHETLDLDRFRSPVVQMMLPFRMPRRRR